MARGIFTPRAIFHGNRFAEPVCETQADQSTA